MKITPFLWFDDNLDAAIAFYRDIFGDAAVLHESRYGDAGPGPAGQIMMATFTLGGQEFMGLNGGPQYQFTPAISLFISCKDQAEVDHHWYSLINGGTPGRCGWLVDRFGLSWQVVPEALGRLMSSPDPARSGRVRQAMLEMSRLDVAGLQAAHDG